MGLNLTTNITDTNTTTDIYEIKMIHADFQKKIDNLKKDAVTRIKNTQVRFVDNKNRIEQDRQVKIRNQFLIFNNNCRNNL